MAEFGIVEDLTLNERYAIVCKPGFRYLTATNEITGRLERHWFNKQVRLPGGCPEYDKNLCELARCLAALGKKGQFNFGEISTGVRIIEIQNGRIYYGDTYLSAAMMACVSLELTVSDDLAG